MADPVRHGWEFIDQAARGSNSWRSYLAVLLRVILYPVGFIAVIVAAGFGATVAVSEQLAPTLRAAVEVLPLAAIVVAGISISLVRALPSCHRRSWRTLIAPDLRIDWLRLAIGAGVELALALTQLIAIHALTGMPWRFAIPVGLPVIVVTLLLIPFQAATEELLFRGYLTQALGRLIRSRVVIITLVGLLFGVLHFGSYGPLTVPYFFLWSVVFSVVSLRDNRLELAIACHATMNLLAVGTAAFSPLVPAVIGLGGEAMQLNWASLAAPAVHGALFYGLTRLLVRLLCPRPPVPEEG